MESVPAAIDRQEAEEIWAWIRQVGPDDAVIADYEVSAPLSSRRLALQLYPGRQPAAGISPLGPEFRWIFVRNDWPHLKVLLDEGFNVVHRGPYLTIARRGDQPGRDFGIFSDFARTILRDKMSRSCNHVRVAFRSPRGSSVVSFFSSAAGPADRERDE